MAADRRELVERYLRGEADVVEARDAASVVLLRDGASGPEVYLLRRRPTMAFAPGMHVFPGGSVDPRDVQATGWAGPPPQQWAGLLGCDEDLARALVCAAVRETFEESGVLLAGTSCSLVVSDTTGDDWEADRVALETRVLSFTDFLDRRGLVLRSDLLGAWWGWLTPEFEPRRYRTWFFVAALPQGQITRDVSSESSSVTWMSAMEVASAVDAGQLLMLPPTYLTCLEIGLHSSPRDVLDAAAARGPVEMFMPVVEGAGDSASLSIPDSLRVLVEQRLS